MTSPQPMSSTAVRSARVRVALLDGHRLIVDGLAARLSSPQARIEVVAALTDWDDLLPRLGDGVDVVVIELDVADSPLAERRIATLAEQGVAAVVIGRHSDAGSVHDALRAGARAFVATSEGADELVAAIHDVAEGREHTGPAAAAALAEWATRTEPSLGRQELAALKLYAQGRSVHEVALSMSTTDETVKSYIKRGRRKYRAAGMDLGTRMLLRRHALKEGWIALD